MKIHVGAAQNCFVVNLENMAKEVIVIIHLAKINMKIYSFMPLNKFSIVKMKKKLERFTNLMVSILLC